MMNLERKPRQKIGKDRGISGLDSNAICWLRLQSDGGGALLAMSKR